MSKNKISAKTVSNALAKALNLSQVAAENFLNEFQKVAIDAISKDKILKINDLGTFRLVWVEPRKSVNVQTGEPVEIAGHYKISFVPDTELKENINTMNQQKEQKDPLKKLGEQAEELKDMLDLINGEPESPEVAETPEQPEEPEQTTPAEEPQPEVEPTPEPTIEPEKEPETPIVPGKTEVKKEPETPEKHNKNCRCTVICLLIALIVLAASFAVYAFWKEPFLSGCTTVKNTISSWFAPEKTPEIVPEIVPIDTVEVEIVEETSIFDQPREYTEFFGTEIVGKGSRLAWIAYKYYGNKAFWVYIYEANREKIANPNKIKWGSKVRVPKLPDYLIDTNNAECMEYAKKLHNEYLNNY